MSEMLLQMKEIVKEFGGVQVLKRVNFDLRRGEVHALIGENGAGKSTLIKVLGGVYFPESGQILIDGREQHFSCAKDALDASIGIIYQEFNLVPSLSIAENIFLGNELRNGKTRLNRTEMIRQASELMKSLGFEQMDCACEVAELSVAQQQMVEIAKALFHHSKILVMDEPTAVLTDQESQKLFEIIQNLKAQGVSIIYVSHRLEEVLELSDRITVLRDGEWITDLDNARHDVTKEMLVSLMVGRSLEQYYPERTEFKGEKIILEVKHLSRKGMYEDISFELRQGEILGITGLVGAGRTEVVKSIFGAIHADSGEILLDGKPLKNGSPSESISQGVAFIPENRKQEGLLLDASVGDNMMMANYEKVSRNGVIRERLKRPFLSENISRLVIKPADPNKIIRDFSGGNQQKVIVAKWLATNPKIMILDEPTRGIDIGAKLEIYELMNRIVQNGCSIIMVSSEMNEIIGMCDRVLVMSEGKLSGEFVRSEFDQKRSMAAGSGLQAI